MAAGHRPVLYQEILEAISPRPGGRYIDGTLGGGGHAWGILQASSPDGRLLGLDLDPQAIALAAQRLIEFGERAVIRQASYTSLAQQMAGLEWPEVDGILLDLGVSSMQLDTPERGFSFQAEAPLDMRFDPDNPLCAADLVNHLPEVELANLIYRYGEEPSSRRIARAIVAARPVETTSQLAQVVLGAIGSRRRGGYAKRNAGFARSKGGKGGYEGYAKASIHPATRTFQALRIAVNDELGGLERTLPVAVEALRPGGRLAVISFHSLEDRIVKQYFRRESTDCLCPPRQPVCTCGHRATIIEGYANIHRPIQPGASEVTENPRSRSARLRVAEKISS